ncbi:hypothetical protein L0657_24300 [Dyadobacter sp. CY345]|uniref:hypothetical protein n=1 Tax=Dyadobacter sp. CY345 TaxID=2909335 RepID=UPI001F28CA2E|nr:hypothetical protein [Dyadobacter sp. CY345]MCF2447098.1 hypothetical protein [Dyadobacter sp. CY345]
MQTLLFWGNGEDLSDFLSAQPNGLVQNVEIQYNTKLGKAYVRSDNQKVLDLLSQKFELLTTSPDEEFPEVVAPEKSGWITVHK